MESDASVRSDLTTIRGWLLGFCILLFPHTFQAAVFLVRYWQVDYPPSVAPHAHEIVATVIMLVGSTLGYLLIVTRNRFTPAFFVLYLPFAFVLLLADPHPIATYVARLHRFGYSNMTHVAQDRMQGTIVYAASSVAIIVTTAYWVRSERVRAVFGSNGLRALRRW